MIANFPISRLNAAEGADQRRPVLLQGLQNGVKQLEHTKHQTYESSESSRGPMVHKNDSGISITAPQPAKAWDIIFDPPKRLSRPSTHRGRFANRVLTEKVLALSGLPKQAPETVNEPPKPKSTALQVDEKGNGYQVSRPTAQSQHTSSGGKSRSDNTDQKQDTGTPSMKGKLDATANILPAAWTIDFQDVAVKSKKPPKATAAALVSDSGVVTLLCCLS